MDKIRVDVGGIKKVKKGTLKDQVAAQIKEEILLNHWRPHQPIVIDEVANELGISHTPIREALAMLELEGLVELSSYSNPRVANITAIDVDEIYEMRKLIEGWAIERAVVNLTKDQLDDLDNVLYEARVEAEKGNYAPHLKADLTLHDTILKSTGNSLFSYLAQRVHDRSIRVRSLVEATGTKQDVIGIIDEHCMMVDALQKRDPKLARKTLIAHLEAGQKRTLFALQQYPEE